MLVLDSDEELIMIKDETGICKLFFDAKPLKLSCTNLGKRDKWMTDGDRMFPIVQPWFDRSWLSFLYHSLSKSNINHSCLGMV